MPGTRTGGIRAAETNKKKYGPDFYTRIGALGGAKSRGGGFAANPDLARLAGALGGASSRKGTLKSTNLDTYEIEQRKKALKDWQRGNR